MQPYQEEYIENCRKYRSITSAPFLRDGGFDAFLGKLMKDISEAGRLAQRNTLLIQEHLMPVLDKIHAQDKETLDDLEKFADALAAPPLSLDVALACRIHEFLLSGYRRVKQRENIIRELYKLGMSRYGFWVMFVTLDIPEALGFSSRMRFCFVEASSYIKYFDDFDETTKSYILRSLANTYLGSFSSWRERFGRVKRTMQTFTDEKYRLSAPNLPWDLYVFTVHRQMAGVLPYNFPDGAPSPEIVAEVMESAHVVYEKQLEDAKKSSQPINAHRLMPYYSAEYNCGILRKEELLSHMEELMDGGDPSVYDENSNYRIISMPAYYVQYLKMMPELLPMRRDYITWLYRRLLSYIHAMPADKVNDDTRTCLRHILAVFYETESGISYREMAQEIMMRFAPELYIHGYVVGRTAQIMCGIILEREPDHFNDIPGIADISELGEKRRVIEEMAFNAGILHDVGKLYFTDLYNNAGRQTLASEEEALRLHTFAARSMLQEHASCVDYVDAAFGHHMWYDGTEGHPDCFIRKNSPYRALIDIISFANYMDGEEDGKATMLPVRTVSFEEKILEAKELEGRRFSPLVTGWLRMTELLIQLKDIYNNGRREGLSKLF